MDMKYALTGNQAIARGFYEAGGQVATAYPGSPTVEILQTIKDHYEDVYSEFSVNEKVALEVGIGASFAGARTMVAMKHVGMNIASDPLMTFTQTTINGGFVLVSGDDPGMASSQNEQDNRLFAKFANMPVLDPSDSSDAILFTKKAFDISERYSCPVMIRITSRLCHSRSIVEEGERIEKQISGFNLGIEDVGMIPPNTFPKQFQKKERLEKLSEATEQYDINGLEANGDGKTLIVTSGLMYHNLKELELDLDILKLGMVYPLPVTWFKQLHEKYERIIVIEEMMPFIENELNLMGIPCEGKEHFSFTGELNPEDIERGLHNAGLIDSMKYEEASQVQTVARLPMFCSGCPHRPVFDVLKKAKVKVIGDIGCYSLSILPPLEVSNSIISMGASIGIMKGMRKAFTMGGIDEPVVAVIGDGTFYHSGMTGLINLLHQLDPKENMTLLILNNGTTAMTGGQNSASSGHYTDQADMDVDMEALIRTMGFDQVRSLDQFEYKATEKTINEAIKHDGLSILITTRPCALNFKIKETPFYVDPEVCIGCRTCVKTNCPPIIMKAYQGMDKLKSSIDRDMCVGCSVCAQVCPVGAIKRTGEEV